MTIIQLLVILGPIVYVASGFIASNIAASKDAPTNLGWKYGVIGVLMAIKEPSRVQCSDDTTHTEAPMKGHRWRTPSWAERRLAQRRKRHSDRRSLERAADRRSGRERRQYI